MYITLILYKERGRHSNVVFVNSQYYIILALIFNSEFSKHYLTGLIVSGFTEQIVSRIDLFFGGKFTIELKLLRNTYTRLITSHSRKLLNIQNFTFVSFEVPVGYR